MKQNDLLTVASLMSILLVLFHITDDVMLGYEPGSINNLIGVMLILFVWLYGTLVLKGRLAGYIIMLLGGLVTAGMPFFHMRGAGVGEVARSSGAYFFVWTLFAMGVTGLFSAVLAASGLVGLRRGRSQ